VRREILSAFLMPMKMLEEEKVSDLVVCPSIYDF
jgi:hypothetical protein